MCLEGKEQSKCKQTGAYQLQCCVCKVIYSQKEWDELVAEPNATTTMGGDSKGDSSSDNEVHTVVLTVFPAKTFGYKLDGGPTNMSRVMDMMSKALEDWNAEFKHQPALKWWSPGTQAAYERLGRALGVAVPAPAAASPPLSIDDLKRFSLRELLAHVNERTASRPYHAGWISETVDAVRQLHERVCGKVVAVEATPVHPPGECVRLPVTADNLDDLDLTMAQLRRLAVRQLDKYWSDGMFSETDPVRKEWLEMIEGRTRRALVAAPAEPPKVKLAQRLAAFVEERAALQADAKALHEKAFPNITWDTSVMTNVVQCALTGCRSYSAIFKPGIGNSHPAWMDGSAQRYFEENGFIVFYDINAGAWVDDKLQPGCRVRVVRF